MLYSGRKNKILGQLQSPKFFFYKILYFTIYFVFSYHLFKHIYFSFISIVQIHLNKEQTIETPPINKKTGSNVKYLLLTLEKTK